MTALAPREVLVLVGAELSTGGALMIAPRRVLSMLGTPEPSTMTLVATRVLGARLAVQAMAAACRPRRITLEVMAGVEALHSASMVGLAVLDGRVRRPALASALAAAIQGGAAALLARSRS